MKTMGILGLAIAVAAVVPLLSMPHASAQPIAGAYYAGEIAGCDDPPCGTVSFRVSPDGSTVKRFKASDVDGVGDCSFSGPQLYPDDLDIEDDSFGPGMPDFFEVSGSFPTEGSAEGTLRLAPHPPEQPPPCDTGVLDWTASSSVGGIAELPDVSDPSAGSYLALAGLAAAACALAAGGWYVRRRWLR
jgi:hypothetical protein